MSHAQAEELEAGLYPVAYSCPCCSHSGFGVIDYPKKDRINCIACDSWAEITFLGEKL